MPSFFFNDTATTEIYTLSLHDALPTSFRQDVCPLWPAKLMRGSPANAASAWTTTPSAPLRKWRPSETDCAGHRYRISPRGAVREWRSEGSPAFEGTGTPASPMEHRAHLEPRAWQRVARTSLGRKGR